MMKTIVFTLYCKNRTSQRKQVAQLSQRDRAAGCISFGQKWKTVTGRQYFTNIIFFQPLWRNWPSKQSNWVKKNAK